MTKNRRKKIEDTNEIAHRVVRKATGDAVEVAGSEAQLESRPKNPAAVELGRRGGRVGGRKRAQNLTKEQLSEIGRLGAQARWKKKP